MAEKKKIQKQSRVGPKGQKLVKLSAEEQKDMKKRVRRILREIWRENKKKRHEGSLSRRIREIISLDVEEGAKFSVLMLMAAGETKRRGSDFGENLIAIFEKYLEMEPSSEGAGNLLKLFRGLRPSVH